MILWLQSFPEISQEEGLIVYRRIILVSMVLTGAFLPLIGHTADKIPSKYLMPAAFSIRCLACFLFVRIVDPNTYMSYISCSLLILSTTVENVAMETLFMKDMPGNVRGSLNGCLHFFGCLGLLLFTESAGWLFDCVGPYAPFALVGAFDAILCLYASFLGLTGQLN
jgi:MFS family permease